MTRKLLVHAPEPVCVSGANIRGGAYSGPESAVRGLISSGLILLATVFTNVGASIITNRIIQAGTAAKDIGWGTGTVGAAVTDTDLTAEAPETLSGNRTVGTESRTTVTVTNDNYQVVGTVTATGSRAIAEAALFDAQSSGTAVPNAHGNLLLHGVFSVVNVSNGDSIAFTFGLKFVPN